MKFIKMFHVPLDVPSVLFWLQSFLVQVLLEPSPYPWKAAGKFLKSSCKDIVSFSTDGYSPYLTMYVVWYGADMVLICNYMPLPYVFHVLPLLHIGYVVLHSALYAPGASAPAFQTKASPGDCSDCTSSTSLRSVVQGRLRLIRLISG